ncbi:TIGR04219 family outer membrane beta-barrel protein [Thalassotalea profundi]|uniref:Outer membrane protein n=1 Tax=Thalassotalea profundi TaxID=2036687 RepID=A0ABQ3INV3_9GAMM|nr:TIGR04219 family outer membrane beta-barrel protein [Thalassotalea profundi]GHE86890.1 outer membrane protein [Thalassotalea profundi]
MKKIFFAATLTALFTTNAQADTVGLYLGGQIWQSEASGVFGEESQLIDFNLKKEQQVNYFVAIEHPLPLLPNVRISSTTLDTTGNTTFLQEFSFGDEVFPDGETVDANFKVSYIDYSVYYELFDNSGFSFDIGGSVRSFMDDITIAGPPDFIDECTPIDIPNHCITNGESIEITQKGKIDTDELVPMLYLASQFNIPLTNVSIFAQGDFSLVSDHSLSDYQVGLSYRLIKSRMGDFNLTLGYRVVRMEFEDLDNLYTELDFKGVFFGAIAHF